MKFTDRTSYLKPPTLMSRERPHLFVLLAAILWGTTGTAQQLAPTGATPAAIGTARLLIGAVGLLALSRFRVGRVPLPPLLIAAAGMAGYQLAFFAGVTRAGVVAATVVAIGSAPLLAGLAAWFFRGETLASMWWVATALAVAGLVILNWPGRITDRSGVLLALVAGACYAVYAVASKEILSTGDPTQAMAAVFAIAAVMLGAVTGFQGLTWVKNDWAIALWLGLAATTCAYTLFARGLRQLKVGTAATLSLAEPLTATLLGFAILGERPVPLAWVGMALIIGGMAAMRFEV